MYIVSQFIGAIGDECCGSDKTADSTKAFTAFVDMESLLYCKYMNPVWSEQELGLLQNKTNLFKVFAW